MLFSDGCRLDRFEVVAHPKRPHSLFRAPDSGVLYRITNIKKRAFRLIDRSPADGFGVNGKAWGQQASARC